MRLSLQFIVLICLVVVAWGYSESLNAEKAPQASTEPALGNRARVSKTFAIPLSFEENQGQTDPSVRYMVRGPGYTMFFTSEGALLSLPAAGPKAGDGPGAEVQPGIRSDDGIIASSNSQGRFEGFALEELAVPVVQSSEQRPKNIQLKLVGANPDATIRGFERLPAKSNYLLGNDPSKWRRGIPHYAEVKYEDIYPGIGLVYYGNQGELEFDFILEPGADPGKIQLELSGSEGLELNAKGDLTLRTCGGGLTLRKPYAYQDVGGERHEIQLSYMLMDETRIRFHLGEYDPAERVVIDPVLAYSTYLGGSGNEAPSTFVGIAVDTFGNAYVTGSSYSLDFPTANPLRGANGGGVDVFVAKLDPSGSALLFSTFLGGSGNDWAGGIAVDPSGNIYVTGRTESNDFPTDNAIQASSAGSSDVFVTKLDPSASGVEILVYSTYLGTSGFDRGDGIDVDSLGNAYVAGSTGATLLPTVVPMRPHAGGGYDCFVLKIDPSGGLLFKTFLGGSGIDLANGITVDSEGRAYVTGRTSSTDFPTTSDAAQPSPGGSPCIVFGFNQGMRDAFVSKIDPEVQELVYSTFLGGTGCDEGTSVAVDPSGNAYVTGSTESTDFHTTENAFKTELDPYQGSTYFPDAFVTKLNVSGQFVYSTYLGGTGTDYGSGIDVDSNGNAHVTGSQFSTDFPENPDRPSVYTSGAFAAKLDASGSLLYSTFPGGLGNSEARGIAIDSAGNAYVTGFTNAADFPTVSAFQATKAGLYDAFVLKIVDTEIDGTIDEGGGAVVDTSSGTSAQVTIPAGVGDTSVAIDVLSPAPPIPIPGGYSGAGTEFVTIQLFPQPAYPLQLPGITIVLPLASPMDPGSLIDLFVVDGTGNLVPKLDGSGNPIVGSVDAGGFTATFTGVVSLSTLVGLIPEGSSVLTVEIDIKPGEFPNSINLGSKGTVPAAIFGGPSFDAAQIDPISLRLAGASVRLKGNGPAMASFEDVNGDGHSDLVVHFNTQELLLKKGDTEAVLTGQTYGGNPIEGRDSVRLVP